MLIGFVLGYCNLEVILVIVRNDDILHFSDCVNLCLRYPFVRVVCSYSTSFLSLWLRMAANVTTLPVLSLSEPESLSPGSVSSRVMAPKKKSKQAETVLALLPGEDEIVGTSSGGRQCVM